MTDVRVPDPAAAEMAARLYGRYRIQFVPRPDLWLQQVPDGWVVDDDNGSTWGPYPTVVAALRSEVVALGEASVPELPLGVSSLRHIHQPSQCHGRGCSVHHPSDHHMATWPTVWRDNHGYFERVCVHGVGHPDPDDLAYLRTRTDVTGVHGCDGCCRSPR